MCLPLTEEVGQLDVLEEAIDDGGGLEGGCGLLNSSNHVDEQDISSEQKDEFEGDNSDL